MRTSEVSGPPVVARTASLDELTAKVRRFGAIKSMRATVAMQIAVLSDDRKKRTEYTDVRGAIVIRRPGFIRAQADVPITGQRALDMVSDGKTFKVHLPWNKRFFTGRNEIEAPSQKRLENIRPQHIRSALLIDPPAADESAVLDNVVEGNSAYHVVVFERQGSDGRRYITRKIWFDRVRLELARVQIYARDANVMTDARYLGWAEENSLPWARTVVITRVSDGYTLSVTTLKPGLNQSVPDSSFELEPPEGIKVEKLGADDSSEATAQALND